MYETHALTVDNERGIATGWLPGELSDQGRALAAELGVRHRSAGLAAVFVSDLARAVQTATIAFPDGTPPIFTDPRLRECDYGAQNGAPVSTLDRSAHIDSPYPGGQSYRDVVAATADFLADVKRRYDGRRVLVIAHSANKWALDCLLCGADLADLVDAPFGWREGWFYEVP